MSLKLMSNNLPLITACLFTCMFIPNFFFNPSDLLNLKSLFYSGCFFYCLFIKIFYQMVEEQQVVWNLMFVHVEVLTAGLSLPCCPLQSLC